MLRDFGQLDAGFRRARLSALRKELIGGQLGQVELDAEAFVQRHKLLVTKNSPEWVSMARGMMRAEIEALQRSLERDEGNYAGVPRDPIVAPPKGRARVVAVPGEAIMDLFATYESENPGSIRKDTMNQARRDIGHFSDFMGGSYPASRIDKKAIREWKTLLVRFPVKATESKVFKGLSFAQIVKHNERVGKPVLTPRTVNRYLSSLGDFCEWLVNNGYLEHDPTVGMSLAKDRRRTTVPFTTDQLNTLFRSPLFTGCQSDEWRNLAKPGNVLIRHHRYWVPLVMLFSGARPGEIAQLAVADVRQEHGHWIMHITDEGDDGKSVKTEGSMRLVPIHKELIRLGFIEYHARIAAGGNVRLFPKAERNSRGQMIAEYSREFPRYLTRLGIKEGRGLSLYSFRHGATDALRRAGYLDEQFGFILGHTKATTTGRYGIVPQGILEKRVELINAIEYPGVELNYL